MNNGNATANRGTNSQENDIIRQLLSRIDELSDALSPQPSGHQVESEVRRTFAGTNSTSQVLSREITSPANQNLPSTANLSIPSTPTSSQVRSTNTRYAPYTVRHFFAGQRSRQSSSSQKRVNRRVNTGDNKPFMRDLVLLSGPNDNVVPRQGTRLALNESGHVISGCRFTKSQSLIEVERTILEAFGEKIPPRVDIELLVSVHSSLVVPALAPGQDGIDGAMLQRLYRNKPVYVRPSEQLLDLETVGSLQQVYIYVNHFLNINTTPPPLPII